MEVNTVRFNEKSMLNITKYLNKTHSINGGSLVRFNEKFYVDCREVSLSENVWTSMGWCISKFISILLVSVDGSIKLVSFIANVRMTLDRFINKWVL